MASSLVRRSVATLCCLVFIGSTAVTRAQQPFVPEVGQPGKDVVWVPSTPEIIEKMLDMAKVTKDDFVIDLGSGDGRIVIAAAKRGAHAMGVEFNPKMVELSKQNAVKEGVADRVTFVEGDMYKADISKATVMALFLLPTNMAQLKDKFLALKPGTRIVSNTYGIEGWPADQTQTLPGGDCSTWCTALLWTVPAKAAGTWKMENGDIVLKQDGNKVTGTIGGVPIENGRIQGIELQFNVGPMNFIAHITGNLMEGEAHGMGAGLVIRPWHADKVGG
jgi:SAM-dependent methyltransferase